MWGACILLGPGEEMGTLRFLCEGRLRSVVLGTAPHVGLAMTSFLVAVLLKLFAHFASFKIFNNLRDRKRESM